MIMRLGIGIATYNRRDLALATVSRVMAHTLHPYTMVVADDGSRDGTVEALRAQHLAVVEGANRGVAWNKNRILFYLMELARCDVVIVLEDDTFPARDGWERDWILAAAHHGHVNLAAGHALSDTLEGAGTGEAPYLVSSVVSHCSALSREAAQFGGYFDVRLTGCGYENIEYAQRLLRYGYGGALRQRDGRTLACHYAVRGGVTVTTPASFVTEAGLARNRAIAQQQALEETPRTCWRDRAGMEQFRAEMATAFPLRQLSSYPAARAGGQNGFNDMTAATRAAPRDPPALQADPALMAPAAPADSAVDRPAGRHTRRGRPSAR